MSLRAHLAACLAVAIATATIAPATARADGASAEPSAEDKESAKVVFGLALSLREQGKLPEALEKFKLANKLYSTPITALELGKTHLALKQLVAAHAAFASVAKIPIRPSESEKSAEARVEAAKLALEVRPRLAELTIALTVGLGTGVPKGVTPSVTIDDVEVPAKTLDSVQLLDPGEHVIVVRASGAEDRRVTVTLVEGQKRVETIAMPTSAPPLLVPPLPKPEKSSTSPLVYLGFGVAGAGLIVGSVTGVMALMKAKNVKGKCDGDLCPPEVSSDLDLSRRLGNVSTVALVVGGVGATIGVIGLVSSGGGAKDAAGVHAFVGLGSAGIRGAF
jgi:hypothetical protein